MSLSCYQDPDIWSFHDINVNMVDSTLTLGDTMRMDDLDGEAVTPFPCAASASITMDLAKAIEAELKASSGIIADSAMDTARMVYYNDQLTLTRSRLHR